ncbi:nuclear polyA polymerase 3 [Cinnamomum micranthum f. kanehirae]|uniref:Poly(A) polymerase n=1 Tax=Cinnamomum micranthum f. kanehirae TaxID=337451 RepID=A0A443ND20_9MAGN|nr:nuclear polyA polymerase 3 [Cinnamomum micranthum f. kanehirae]
MEEERDRSLHQFMVEEDLVPSQEEELKRKYAIEQLKEIVQLWVKKVAWQRRLPKNEIARAGAKILTYGSYGLGVHGPESDIDALCVGPAFATIAEDFFIVLHNMLQSRPEVSEIQCVKNAKVRLMRFKFNGISIDLPYAQLPVLSVPENVNLFDPFFLQRIDEKNLRNLSGVHANMRILELVPNLGNFQSMLRCVKLWAKRRGVYSHLLGFLGGIHLAILAAFICQNNPTLSVSALISIFFDTFSKWPWKEPVFLQDGLKLVRKVPDSLSMPIRMPCPPYDWCNSNITSNTFKKISGELHRGHAIMSQGPDFKWSNLFDPFPYTPRYRRLARIFLSAPDDDGLRDWVGWVKSRFRSLLLKLEELQGFCDPNPVEFVEHDVAEPNTVFYWGLSSNGRSSIDMDSLKEEFMKSVENGDQGSGCRLELTIVNSQQLPKDAQFYCLSEKDSKAYWRIPDYRRPRQPVYSQHLPRYCVGYVSINRVEHPNDGG